MSRSAHAGVDAAKESFDDLWDRLEDSPLAASVQAVDQLTYLFLLQYLELEDDRQARIDSDRDSLFEGRDDPLRWSNWRHFPAREQFDHLQRRVFPWLHEIADANNVPTPLAQNPVFLFPEPSLLSETVRAVDALDIFSLPPAQRGEFYEYLVAQIRFEREEARNQGKYLTPRHLTSAIVRLIDPVPGEIVFDPACGTGGFLISAHRHILQHATSPEMTELGEQSGSGPVGDLLTERQRALLLEGGLQGIDSAREMARVATMNLLLHGIPQPSVLLRDSLGESFQRSGFADVVVSNPPFLKRDVKAVGRMSIETKDSADLFIQLALDALTPGGRAAIVVPDGVLFSEVPLARVDLRKRLVEDFRLDAIVSLPAGAFEPYVGTKTSVVFLTKGSRTEDVWMYDLEHDGFTLTKQRSPSDLNEIPDLLARWPSRSEGDRSFLVGVEEIRELEYDLAVSRYKPVRFDEPAHEEPAAIGQRMQALSDSLRERMERISELLGGSS